jgi:uncharacterized protein YgiB involved in biofilm formation
MQKRTLLFAAIGTISTFMLSACGEEMPEINEDNCNGAWYTAKKAGLTASGIDKYMAKCQKFENAKEKEKEKSNE